jgi:ribosomal protein S18 acetylase RimI-like enzyme
MKPRPPSLPLPPGYTIVPVRTTYLEMRIRPQTEPVAVPPGCTVERWEKPGTADYRELFTAVGGPWGWSGRLIMSDEECRALIRAKTTEVHRLRQSGAVAGFVELDRSVPGQAEIAYFGLLPDFIGRGLGKFLLDRAVRLAWLGDTERVWLHTCSYDHAGALAVYRRAGFSVTDERIEMQPYADEFLGRHRPTGG